MFFQREAYRRRSSSIQGYHYAICKANLYKASWENRRRPLFWGCYVYIIQVFFPLC
ncbi:hypothetical protein Hanom_Chr04g00357281 [Helianthus anomalus]